MEHWRASSHEKNKVIVLGMINKVYGDAVRAWAVTWFEENKPEWLPLCPPAGAI